MEPLKIIDTTLCLLMWNVKQGSLLSESRYQGTAQNYDTILCLLMRNVKQESCA